MKKKLEAELISIAHRILKLKNKSDVVTLHQETQKLYEKLSVLRFVEESFGDVKPTIGSSELAAQLDEYFDKDQNIQLSESAPEPEIEKESPKPQPEVEEVPATPEIEEETPEESGEQPEDAPAEPIASDKTEVDGVEETEAAETEPEQEEEKTTEEMPAEPQSEEPAQSDTEEDSDSGGDEKSAAAAEITEIPADVPPTPEQPETAIELEIADLPDGNDPKASEDKKEDLFIPSFELAFDPKSPETEEQKPETPASPQFSFDDLLGKDYADPVFVKPDQVNSEKKFSDYTFKDAETIKSESKSISLNDRLSKGITIGLNDRIAFIKHLFADSSEDYNRVLSQLMTFDNYEEARGFINEMVKPDYNGWNGKDEYAERFMDIVEKRFS